MLSFKTAAALKNAGLKWEPKEGDWFGCFSRDGKERAITLVSWEKTDEYFVLSVIWLPSLSDLLSEIERRNCLWYLTQYSGKYEFGLKLRRQFYADTPEEAAGQALLWIMEQEDK